MNTEYKVKEKMSKRLDRIKQVYKVPRGSYKELSPLDNIISIELTTGDHPDSLYCYLLDKNKKVSPRITLKFFYKFYFEELDKPKGDEIYLPFRRFFNLRSHDHTFENADCEDLIKCILTLWNEKFNKK